MRSGELLAVVTPILRTSAGMRGWAIATRFWTWTCNIEVGAEVEGHVDLEAAVSGRARGHVDHVLDAVDLLLERSNHRGGDHVRARPGILAADPHHRRRDLRILGDRQAPDRHRAEDDEDDRNDRGEDRPVDEEVGEAHPRVSLNWRPLEGRRSMLKRGPSAVA